MEIRVTLQKVNGVWEIRTLDNIDRWEDEGPSDEKELVFSCQSEAEALRFLEENTYYRLVKAA